MDSIFEEQKPVIVSAKEFKKMESYKKCFETKLFTVAHYLGKREKEDEPIRISQNGKAVEFEEDLSSGHSGSIIIISQCRKSGHQRPS